jgi:hypothetical protein
MLFIVYKGGLLMKKIVLLAAFIFLLSTLSSCTIKPRTQDTGPTQENTPSPTPKPSTADNPVKPTEAESKITNDLLEKNMMAADSYRRKTKTTTKIEGQPDFVEIGECAYIKNPLSAYNLLDFVSAGSYTEELIINGTMWSRAKKDDKWDKCEPGQWFKDPPLAFKYKLSVLHFPISYEKLKYEKVGNENVNGLNCIKYTVSGTYNDEITFELSKDKFGITLSATGTIWIAEDPTIKQVIVRQRITVDSDIINKTLSAGKGNPNHVISKDIIEDDVIDLNSAEIQPPPDSQVKQQPPQEN